MQYHFCLFFFILLLPSFFLFFFFFNDTATTEIYTLSLHDALPISSTSLWSRRLFSWLPMPLFSRSIRSRPDASREERHRQDRKSTRLNSSHQIISYAVFCLKKKKTTNNIIKCIDRS